MTWFEEKVQDVAQTVQMGGLFGYSTVFAKISTVRAAAMVSTRMEVKSWQSSG